MSTKSVAKILATRDSGLHSLLERAKHLKLITQALRESLKPPLAEHVTVTNLREQTAIISTDTSAWLTQLRYQAPIILRTLQQLPGLQGLQKVQFKIQPASEAPPPPPPRRATLSTSSAQLLKSAALGTEDDELAEALYRLSQHNDASEP